MVPQVQPGVTLSIVWNKPYIPHDIVQIQKENIYE